MGQSSSQLDAPSQQMEIARTPTPDLSEVDGRAARDPVEQDSVMVIQPQLEQQQEQQQEQSIRGSSSNVRKTSIVNAPPQTITATTSAPPSTTTTRAKVTKKRASDGTQRRLLSTQVPKAVGSEVSSEEEHRTLLRKARKALPKAALDEADAPAVLRPTIVKPHVFSPLRRTKVPPKAPKSPSPVLLPPPQVIIPSSEVVAATQSQPLEHHVDILQQRPPRAQSLLESPARPSTSANMPKSPFRSSSNVLAELQHTMKGDDWFSNIDEAVAEAAENQRAASSAIKRENITLGQGKKDRGVSSAMPVSVEVASSARAGVYSTNVRPSASNDVSAHDGDDAAKDVEGVAEEGAGNADEDDRDPDWPLPTEEEVQEHLQLRGLTADDLEHEEMIEEPQSSWETRENTRRRARNVLREHIVKWSLQRKVYKGLAKYVPGEDGEPVVVYAAPGENFNAKKHTKAERQEAKALKASMTSTRIALHESIVRSEVEIRIIADDDAARRASLAAQDGVALTAEAFVAAQSPSSTGDAAFAEESVAVDEGHEVAGARDAGLGLDQTVVDAEESHEVDVKPALAAGEGDRPAENVAVNLTSKTEPAPKRKQRKGKEKSRTDRPGAAGVAEANVANGTSPDPLSKKQRKVSRPSGSANIGRAVLIAPIPTPPKSDDPFTMTSQQPVGVQVGDWLASQSEEPPVPPEQVEQEPLASHHAKPSHKRKRQSPTNEDSDFEEVAPEDSNSVTTSARAEMKEAKTFSSAKKRRTDNVDLSDAPKTKKRRSNAEVAERPEKARRSVTMSGPFTQEEKELADKIFDNVLQKEGMRESELVAQVQNWKTCGTLKTDMFAAFSDRSVDSVRKFCQRRWHGQERGPWTPDQDEALRKAYASQPGKWTVISDSVGRTAADCKDRWRSQFESNHISHGPWTVEEEEKLMTAVDECIESIKKEKHDDLDLLRDRERLEALVSWRVVSDKLSGKRTSRRCREKYGKLRMTQAKTRNQDVSWSTTQRAKGGDDSEKVALARRKVKQFEIGDYYDVFVEIHSSFKDPHQHFRDEKNVVWSIVSAKNPHSRFSMHSYSSALRRVALESAIQTWPANNAKIKKKLERVDTIPAKALVLARWVENMNAGRLDTMTRTYQTDLIGKSKEELESIKRARKDQFAQGPRKNNGRSKDFVTDSEEEEDDELTMANPSMSQARIPAAVFEERSGISESENDEENESVPGGHVADSDEDEEEYASEISRTVPDSQFQEDNDMAMSDVESLKGTPSIGPSNFLTG